MRPVFLSSQYRGLIPFDLPPKIHNILMKLEKNTLYKRYVRALSAGQKVRFLLPNSEDTVLAMVSVLFAMYPLENITY